MKKTLMVVMIMVFLGSVAYSADMGMTSGQSGAVKSISLPIVTIELKPGPDKAKADSYCMICHSTDYITMQPPFSKAQWTATVTKMIKTFGAPIPPEDAEKVINYLATAYGTGN
jgi:hypothetical protein